MTVKELCAITNEKFCILFKEEIKCEAFATKAYGTDEIPADLLNCEIDFVNINTDPWGLPYLEISLKTLDK